MRRRGIWRTCWLGRLVRGLRPDRNPLRRRTDRAEAAIAAGLLAAFLAGAPLAAVTAGHWTHAASVRTQHAQQAASYRVPAVLQQNVPGPVYTEYGTSQDVVRARWSAPDGSTRVGYVGVPAAARAGTTVTVWTDASGRLTDPPLQPAQVAHQAALAAMTAPLIPAILLLAVWKLARWALDRRRLAAWDNDWRAFGPQWTSRR